MKIWAIMRRDLRKLLRNPITLLSTVILLVTYVLTTTAVVAYAVAQRQLANLGELRRSDRALESVQVGKR